MIQTKYVTLEELEAGLGFIHQSPKEAGLLELIVRRPQIDEREIIEEAELDLRAGVDLDLSATNMPPGTRLALGSAVIEVTDQPHTGCDKFTARFGRDAMKWVNSPLGRQLHLRGVNAKIVQPGVIRVGDVVKKL